MLWRKWVIYPTAFFVIILAGYPEQDDFPVLKGPYLGQTPPGMTPEIFAPGVLNNDKTGAFCTIFSPKGDEFYFTYFQKSEEEIPGGIAWSGLLESLWAPNSTEDRYSEENRNDELK